MNSHYDIIVIGAGSGGLGVGIGMAKFGFKVLMVEKNQHNFGGECLNSGCIPSKALIHVANTLAQARESTQFGFTLTGETNLDRVLEYVHSRQDIIRAHESPQYLREEGIDVEIGEAHFTGKQEIEVNGQKVKAKRILVATGSKPRMIQVPGQEQMKVYTNESLFNLKTLPKNLLVVGAGPIGLEMSQCFARLGSKVVVTDRGNRIMNKELPEVSALVQERLEQEGIAFQLNCELQAFEDGQLALLKNENGQTQKVPCDAVLVGIGREISYQGLQLEKAGVKMKKSRPIIDDYLRAKGNSKVVFAGDAAQTLLFSHAAELHTTILLTNFFSPWPFKKKWTTDNFSWVTFTDPQVATFGLSQSEIENRGLAYDKIDFKMDGDDRATTSNYRYGRLILFLKKNRLNPRNGKILGGTIVAPNAGEMIQELILAKEKGLGAGALFNKVYPYPTQSRVTKIALVEEFSGGLTPAIKKLLRLLYH